MLSVGRLPLCTFPRKGNKGQGSGLTARGLCQAAGQMCSASMAVTARDIDCGVATLADGPLL